MKSVFKNIFSVVLTLSVSSSLWAKDVCMIVVTSQEGVAIYGTRSCDGERRETLPVANINTLEAVSGQLSALYQEGLRLINCQTNQGGQGVEYVCIVAR